MNEAKLLEQILSEENLKLAMKKVKDNRGEPGIDGIRTGDPEDYWYEHGKEIKEKIRQRKYKPQPVLRVEIPKPNGGVRNLGIPTVADRMIQQAITQVITPHFEKTFHEHSYGFRPERCAQQAIVKALEMMNRHNDWIVDIDLEKFFDTVPHDKLMTLVAKQIEDGDVVSLIRKYLVSGIMIDDEYKESIIGTPQGGNLSPLLSNIMLNELDWELEARGLNMVRYADDCIILVGSEKGADRVMRSELTSRSWGVSMEYRIMRLNQTIRGWVNYFKFGNMKTTCEQIDRHMRSRLRMCYWKQWKKVSTKYKELQKLGIPKGKAWEWANSRKSYARVAGSYVMHRAMSNARFKEKGLIFLSTHYAKVHI